jgi:hypothetical protein
MANDITKFNPSALPTHFVQDPQASALARSLAGGGNLGKRLSIKGGVFRMIVDGTEVQAIDERYLDVIIVNAQPHVGRTFYAGKYNEETASAPVCWSEDGKFPAKNVTKPQHGNCEACPQNVKGSGDGDTRACRFSQRLAVVLAADPEGAVLQLQVPAKSLFGKEEAGNYPLQAYARFLLAGKASPDMVVTRLKFDTKSESPKLFFKAMRWLEADEFELVRVKSQSPEALQAIANSPAALDGVRDVEEEVEAPAPSKPAKRVAVQDVEDVEPVKVKKAAPPPAEEDDEEEEAPPPKAKVKKAAPPPVEDDEEEEAPPPPKKKAAPAPVDEDDEEDAPPPPKKAPKAKVKKAAAPVEDDEEEEEAPPPPPKKKAAAPAVEEPALRKTPAPKSGNLASVLANWDEDEE